MRAAARVAIILAVLVLLYGVGLILWLKGLLDA